MEDIRDKEIMLKAIPFKAIKGSFAVECKGWGRNKMYNARTVTPENRNQGNLEYTKGKRNVIDYNECP